jgi:hypothetical protein
LEWAIILTAHRIIDSIETVLPPMDLDLLASGSGVIAEAEGASYAPAVAATE